MFALFRYFNKEEPLENGQYILKSENFFLSPVYIDAVNGEYFLLSDRSPLNLDNYQAYEHVFPLKNIPDDAPEDIGEWYIEYERNVTYKTHQNEKNQTVYTFTDSKYCEFELFFDEYGNLHYNYLDDNLIQYIPKHGQGWRNANTPNDFSIEREVVLNKPAIQLLVSILNSFISNYSLSEVSKLIDDSKTNRGFSFLHFEDVNGNVYNFQDSSTATEARIWFGRKSYVARIGDKSYNADDFEAQLREGTIPEINDINQEFGLSLLISDRSEISVYHAKKIIEVILKEID